MSISELEHRLRAICFDARANTVSDIADPALRADAEYLSAQIAEQRANRKDALRAHHDINQPAYRTAAQAATRRKRDALGRKIWVLHHEGKSKGEICRALGVGYRCVYRHLNEFGPPDPACPACGRLYDEPPRVEP